jgi:hypothetical protein
MDLTGPKDPHIIGIRGIESLGPVLHEDKKKTL